MVNLQLCWCSWSCSYSELTHRQSSKVHLLSPPETEHEIQWETRFLVQSHWVGLDSSPFPQKNKGFHRNSVAHSVSAIFCLSYKVFFFFNFLFFWFPTKLLTQQSLSEQVIPASSTLPIIRALGFKKDVEVVPASYMNQSVYLHMGHLQSFFWM